MKIAIRGYRYYRDINTSGTKDCAGWLAAQLAGLIPMDAKRDRVGLYLATADAAVDVSVSFWQDALAEGVDFVNPRDFHWTLASSLAAQAAAQAELRGPVLTLVGGGEAASGALSQGIGALEREEIDLAVIGALNPAGGLEDAAVNPAVLVILGSSESRALGYIEMVEPANEAEACTDAVEPLSRICLALEEGASTVLSAPYERGYRIAPAK